MHAQHSEAGNVGCVNRIAYKAIADQTKKQRPEAWASQGKR